MTGYGRGELNNDIASISLEIKSVNHRNFEFSARSPKGYGYLDQKIKLYISEHITRGKVDAYINIEMLSNDDIDIKIDKNLANAYIKAINELSKEQGLDEGVTAYSILRMPDIVKVSSRLVSEDEMWDLFYPICVCAVENLIQSRTNEGINIKENIKTKIEQLQIYLTDIEKIYPESLADYKKRLENNLREILNGTAIDEQRILTECALFADRTCIDEETVRLHSHISELYNLLSSDIPVGRKFDFIIQEINREINTIGSKSQNIYITKLIVEMKSEVERIREQIQNIE